MDLPTHQHLAALIADGKLVDAESRLHQLLQSDARDIDAMHLLVQVLTPDLSR